MGAYHYSAIDAKGNTKRGVLEGDSERQIRSILRERDLFPEMVMLVAETNNARYRFTLKRKKFSVSILALMTRQLATLISAGLPVEESLKAVAEQTEHHYPKSIIMSVRQYVCEGHSLAYGFKQHASVFPALYCAQISAGESSGHLPMVLERLADYIESKQAMRQKLQTALIYPAVMMLVSMAILIFLLSYVVPQMVDLFDNIDQALPAVTIILLSCSAFLKSQGLTLLLTIVALGFIWRKLIAKKGAFQLCIHRLLLRLPLIKHYTKLINTARFLKTFSVMIGAQIPVLDAMQASQALVSNLVIQTSIALAIDRVREGANICMALRATGFFQAMSLHLIANGEASGQLGAMLERAAINEENEIKQFLEVSLTLFEPIMILVMGALVLFIVLAIMLPIFSMNELVN